MKVLFLGLTLLLAKVYAQQYDHPVLAYGVLKNVPASADDGEREFILNLDDDDGLLVVENNNRCDGDRFQTCIQQYASDLGLEEIPKDSLAFVRELKDIVEEEGLDGLKKECRAGTNLKRCLGSQYEMCVNEDYLKSIGVQEADAKVFITLSAQMTYQCTGGLDALIRNWPCISRVERASRRAFERCQSDYSSKVQQDPSNICKHTQEMVDCMTGPFKQSCPPAAYGVICHSMQIGIATTLPQCSIICTKGSKDIRMRGEGRADTLSTFLARVLIENIPTHQFQAFRRRSWPLTTATCDDARFKRCINKFVKDIGLSTLPKRAAALSSYMNQLIAARKTAGFEQICTAARNIGTCLGDQMESCFTAQHLEDMGISPLDVLIYRELQAALASECGSGYDAIHDNVECMLNCAERHQSDFVQCATEFQRNIQRDPAHACDYAQTFTRCNSGLFQQSCGADLGAALCNAMRAEITVVLPNCKNLTCLSQEDSELIDSIGLLSGRPGTFVMDVLGDALPASMLRQQQATPTTQDDDDDNDDSDEDNDEVTDNPRAKCNDSKFGQCLKGYAQQLGLKSFPADPAEYGKALQTIIEKYGKIGFKKICISGAKLGKCLGRQQIGACINVDHLIQLGLTKAQAEGYIMITRIMAFECTKGYRAIFNNFDCILNVQKRYNDTFIKCAQDFEKKAKQDPKNICKYSQQFVSCDSKPYAEKCNRQVGSTICQIFQIVFKQTLPKCPIKCNRDGVDNGDEIPAALLVPAREVQVPVDEEPIDD